MTADIKKNCTNSVHKSKFCPVRSRQNSEISKLTMSVQTKTSKTSQKLRIHSSCSSTALSTAFLYLSATDSRPCQSLALQPSSQVYQNLNHGNLWYMPFLNNFMASDPNLYKRLPFSSNSKAFIVPCQRYSLGLYFRRMPASAFWR